MSLLNTLKLASALVIMPFASIAIINPAFNIGSFFGGLFLGWFVLLMGVNER